MEQNSYRIIFRGLPMPPRMSDLYARTRSGKQVKCRNHPFFKGMADYALMHGPTVRKARDRIGDDIIRVNRYFCFHYSSLWTLAATPKIMDVSNRLKAFDDELAKLLQVDDSRFWLGIEEKILIGDEHPECVIVEISPYRQRQKQDLLNELGITWQDAAPATGSFSKLARQRSSSASARRVTGKSKSR